MLVIGNNLIAICIYTLYVLVMPDPGVSRPEPSRARNGVLCWCFNSSVM